MTAYDESKMQTALDSLSITERGRQVKPMLREFLAYAGTLNDGGKAAVESLIHYAFNGHQSAVDGALKTGRVSQEDAA